MCSSPLRDDIKPSLSVSVGTDGRILFHDFAEEDRLPKDVTKDILERIGIEWKDVLPEKQEPTKKVSSFDYKNIVAKYNYGNGIFMLRDKNKNFIWRYRDESKDKWVFKQPDWVEPYQRGEVSETVYFVEGEKDVDNASEKLNLFVFSPFNGANLPTKRDKYEAEIAKYEKIASGRNVIIIPDNDKKGKSFAQEMAAVLSPYAKSLKVIDLTKGFDNVPEKGDISDILEMYSPEETSRILSQLVENESEWLPFDIPEPEQKTRCRNGSEYAGNLNIEYLWEPYFPLDEFSDVFGKSGSGKTFFVALVCASTTTGQFPTERKQPGTVLYISGEESFDEIADRISRAGGNLERVTIIDKNDSIGLNFDDGFDEFSEIVKSVSPDLLVCDPWQCFCGERVDLNRQNMTRPLLQKISLLAGQAHCCIIFLAHMNKTQFTIDANDGLSGSSEIVNAARSAIRVIEDEEDPDRRICIHTKSNHRKRGKSICYRFLGDRIVWDGFSEITKETLEQASRSRKTPLEILKLTGSTEESHQKIISALLEESRNTEICGVRITYDEFKLKYGDAIFGGKQPKRVLDELIDDMQFRNVMLKTGLDIRRGTKHFNGFYLQKLPEIESEEN